MADLLCRECGATFSHDKAGTRPARCAPCRAATPNRHRYPAKTCEVCGTSFQGTAPQVRTCSVECGGILRQRGNKRFGHWCSIAFPKCRSCGVIFTTRFIRQRACSDACLRSIRQDAQMRRRARKLDVDAEPYSRAEIALRDGYACGLCDSPVDMALSWPHPFSRSIDHIVPLSLGGPDAPSNVQLAHLSCNVAKGARVSEGVAHFA